MKDDFFFGLISICEDLKWMSYWNQSSFNKTDKKGILDKKPTYQKYLNEISLTIYKPFTYTFILEKNYIVFLHSSLFLLSIYVCKNNLEICYTKSLIKSNWRNRKLMGEMDDLDIFIMFDEENVSTLFKFYLFTNPDLSSCSENLQYIILKCLDALILAI